MTTPPQPKRGAGSAAVFLLLAALPLADLALPGCGQAQKTPEQIRAETQADIAATNAKLLTDPIAIKCRAYSGPAYDGERAKLCRHLRLNPRVADARVEPNGGEYDPGLTVLLRGGVSAAQTRAVAHRIRVYMTAHYSGDRALIVREINIHHPADENADAASFRRITGDNLGMVGAIVQNGVEDSDQAIDPKWHIEIDRRQVE